MIVYLDNNFICHLVNDGIMQAVDIPIFNNKCSTYIEGYRFVPKGQSWIRFDGVIFSGEMLTPAEDYSRLQKAQLQYELDETKRLSNLNIPQEQDFIATQNYTIGNFLAVYGNIYEVIQTIPMYTSINNNNTILTTVEHYLDTLKEEKQ